MGLLQRSIFARSFSSSLQGSHGDRAVASDCPDAGGWCAARCQSDLARSKKTDAHAFAPNRVTSRLVCVFAAQR